MSALEESLEPTSQWTPAGLLINAAWFGFAIVVGVGLMKRRFWAWILNWPLLAMTTLTTALYPIAKMPRGSLTPGETSGMFFALLAVLAVVWLLPNTIYFAKRVDLFPRFSRETTRQSTMPQEDEPSRPQEANPRPQAPERGEDSPGAGTAASGPKRAKECPPPDHRPGHVDPTPQGESAEGGPATRAKWQAQPRGQTLDAGTLIILAALLVFVVGVIVIASTRASSVSQTSSRISEAQHENGSSTIPPADSRRVVPHEQLQRVQAGDYPTPSAATKKPALPSPLWARLADLVADERFKALPPVKKRIAIQRFLSRTLPEYATLTQEQKDDLARTVSEGYGITIDQPESAPVQTRDPTKEAGSGSTDQPTTTEAPPFRLKAWTDVLPPEGRWQTRSETSASSKTAAVPRQGTASAAVVLDKLFTDPRFWELPEETRKTTLHKMLVALSSEYAQSDGESQRQWQDYILSRVHEALQKGEYYSPLPDQKPTAAMPIAPRVAENATPSSRSSEQPADGGPPTALPRTPDPTESPCRLEVYFNSPLSRGEVVVRLDDSPEQGFAFDFGGHGGLFTRRKQNGGIVEESLDLSEGEHRISARVLDRKRQTLGEGGPFLVQAKPGDRWTLRIAVDLPSENPSFHLVRVTKGSATPAVPR
ncbi:MAG TPA: hypothetical protein PLS53_01735 [Thermoanaerobaculaceae bacterium]|nr:hypothetical protein [Thermoanaerobaculaceae bacterium]